MRTLTYGDLQSATALLRPIDKLNLTTQLVDLWGIPRESTGLTTEAMAGKSGALLKQVAKKALDAIGNRMTPAELAQPLPIGTIRAFMNRNPESTIARSGAVVRLITMIKSRAHNSDVNSDRQVA